MKLVRHYLESIDGVELFPLIAIIIFFLFFILIGIWVFGLKKSYINEMSEMPLSDDI